MFLCLVLTEGSWSYFAKAFKKDAVIKSALAEESGNDYSFTDDEDTLYNFVQVNGSKQYGRLRRTKIVTPNTLSYYTNPEHLALDPDGGGAKYILTSDEYSTKPYDFTNEIIHLNGSDGHTSFNGYYAYLDTYLEKRGAV